MSTENIRMPAVLGSELLPFVPEVIARFKYLHPEVTIMFNDRTIDIEGPESDNTKIIRDLMFCLYRQKIFVQTLPLKQMLIEGVTGLARRSA